MSKKVAVNVSGVPEAPGPVVRLTQDLAEIRGLLEARRAYAATVFGYLEPRFFSHTRWYVSERQGEKALLMEAHGGAGASIYMQGDTGALAAILAEVGLARHSFIAFEAHHRELVQQHFVLRSPQRLLRMRVAASTFRPVSSTAAALSPGDLSKANDLYRSDSGAWLSHRNVTEGLYYGVWDSGKMVSIAGTQTISADHGASVVANVLTHRDYRGRGYATQCVGALTAELLNRVQDVMLNVDPENTPAMRVYQRLGYQEEHRLGEAWAFWKGRSLFDRVMAAVYRWFAL